MLAEGMKEAARRKARDWCLASRKDGIYGGGILPHVRQLNVLGELEMLRVWRKRGKSEA